MKITIIGHVPSKKNQYLRSKNGRMFRNSKLVAEIDAITWQIKAQTKNLKPLDNPSINAHFVCPDRRSDMDNKWTCIQDCLVAGGVLENDNLNHLRGPITLSATIVPGEEYTIIDIEGSWDAL
jgi:Holliday junction resolvase RusA-like endonuclease